MFCTVNSGCKPEFCCSYCSVKCSNISANVFSGVDILVCAKTMFPWKQASLSVKKLPQYHIKSLNSDNISVHTNIRKCNCDILHDLCSFQIYFREKNIISVKKRYLEYLGVSWQLGTFGEALDAGLSISWLWLHVIFAFCCILHSNSLFKCILMLLIIHCVFS